MSGSESSDELTPESPTGVLMPGRDRSRRLSIDQLPYREGRNGWVSETIILLEKLRKNSVFLSEYHRGRFYHYKSFAKYFDLPVLSLSAIGASAAIGLQPYVSQPTISVVSCAVGLTVSIITSIKLYLNISDAMTNELKMSKDFYSLSIELYKTLSLHPKDRGMNATDYLNKQYSHYLKLTESSNLLKQKFVKDELAHRHYEIEPQNRFGSIVSFRSKAAVTEEDKEEHAV